MKLTPENYEQIASFAEVGYVPWRELFPTPLFEMAYEGKVVSKERARNNFHTPKKTRDFEKAVAEAAIDIQENPDVIYCPVSVVLTIADKAPKGLTPFIASLRHKHQGDVDNKTKAITDALNAIIYKDDVQINHFSIVRRYMRTDGFIVSIYRNGLSNNELTQLKKYL